MTIGFTGGITIVTDYVREKQRRTREVFVPLSHAPGHAQVDFGETLGVIAGVERKLHYFAMSLPHSDAFFMKAYPAETTEAFCDGHNAAFGFFGGVPLSALYDNTVIAVAKILGDGKRVRTRTFSELQSHYLFEDRFGRPGKGNDKGNVEGVIGYGRRNFLVPAPRFDSFDDLNAWLEDQCLKRQGDVVRGHSESIGERLMRDLAAIDNRTTVLILGDARNNYNDPRGWCLRDIHNKAKNVIWLNPESPSAWGFGDSVMDRYTPYCDVVEECRNLRQLAKVVDQIVL